jgi:hypothetical protein
MLLLRKTLATATVLLLFTAGALAQCPDLIELDCGGGTAWFGLRHDGANVAQGQTVTLPCDGAILSAEFKFVITGNPNAGVPSLVAGDAIHVAVQDSDGLTIMMATATVPANVYSGWISFEFPEDMTVPAGVYLFAAYTTVEGQCSFAFCPDEDLYPEGVRMASLNGIDGPWFDFVDGHDVPFRVYVNSDSVAAETRSLSSIKGLFR